MAEGLEKASIISLISDWACSVTNFHDFLAPLDNKYSLPLSVEINLPWYCFLSALWLQQSEKWNVDTSKQMLQVSRTPSILHCWPPWRIMTSFIYGEYSQNSEQIFKLPTGGIMSENLTLLFQHFLSTTFWSLRTFSQLFCTNQLSPIHFIVLWSLLWKVRLRGGDV